MPKTPYQNFLEDARKKGYVKSPFNFDPEGGILPEECLVCGAGCGKVERDVCFAEWEE